MGDTRYDGPECETRRDALRRVWFDGWSEGVIWMWRRTRQAIRRDDQRASLERRVIHRIAAELRSAGGSDRPPR